MDPDERLPKEILKAADEISIRTLGVPEKYGGIELNQKQKIAVLQSCRGNCPWRFRTC
ncbi:MAG: hypothetical protein Ct9H300mP28_33260 [Pseudomonadota bacterium]|nr:MAG: hypothetical protein Ct9H300mP28_33260 [Pseudomonadota bacterium]